MYNKLSGVLFILALIMLIPGVSLPVLTLKTTVDKQKMTDLVVDDIFGSEETQSTIGQFARSMVRQIDVQGTMEIFEKTRSVLGTMDDLISSGHYFVGILIGFFAVVIPLIKLILTGSAALARGTARKIQLYTISTFISKWSMSDVFVMAIFVGYLAANADSNTADAVQTSAWLGPGFYYFTAYCLLSVASAQILGKYLSQLKKQTE